MIEENNEIVDEMEDILGFSKSEKKEETPEKKEEQDPNADEKKEGTPETKKEKTEEKTPAIKTTTVTDEQMSINTEIAKIDVKIEALESESVDIASFYDNLENELSEDEQALEFSDKPAYMKLVGLKAKEYESKNSNVDEIKTLKDEKKELSLVYERQSAITEVTAKYPDYDHETILSYFNDDLSKSQQQEIFDNSDSYTSIYEKTYQKYINSNPTNIKQTPAPQIPNVNNVRKQPPADNEIDNNLTSDDERLQEALGLS